MRGVPVVVLLALLAGCASEPDTPSPPPDVPIAARDCRLLLVHADDEATSTEVEPILPRNVTLVTRDGHALLTLGVLVCGAAERPHLAYAWLAADITQEGAPRQLVLDHWTAIDAGTLATYAEAARVERLVLDISDGAVVAEAANATARMRVVMPETPREATLPRALALTLPTGARLDVSLTPTAPARASAGAFEMPVGSLAREIMGASGVRASMYAPALSVEGLLRA